MTTAFVVISGLGLTLGVGYPLLATVCYPVYKRLGGDLGFREYMRAL